MYNGFMPNLLDFTFATSEEIRTALAERLKAARLGRNMQQSELAAAAGVSRGTVHNLETKAQCSFDSVVRVAMAQGMARICRPSSCAHQHRLPRCRPPTGQSASEHLPGLALEKADGVLGRLGPRYRYGMGVES